MGLLGKLFGSKELPQVPQPEIPEFLFELTVVRGADALNELDRLQAIGREEGYCPVIIGEEDEFRFFDEHFEDSSRSVEDVIAASESMTPDSFIEKKIAEQPDFYDVASGEVPDGPFPDPGILVHQDSLTNKPKPWIFIARVPETETWKIPAHFRYGGWNDCPFPEEHVAMWRYWNEKYGAEIVCVTHDIIQAKVSRPPMSFEDAKHLAREQFVYCTDIVYQGVETLENLAATIQESETWFFWWD